MDGVLGRNRIAGYLGEDGIRVSADQIMITNGAKHGIEPVCQVLLDQGDAVVVTAPTYQTAIPIFRSFDVEFFEIGQDREGLDTDELATALHQIEREDRRLGRQERLTHLLHSRADRPT